MRIPGTAASHSFPEVYKTGEPPAPSPESTDDNQVGFYDLLKVKDKGELSVLFLL